MSAVRLASDSVGIVDLPADKLWGVQTERSLEYFSVGKTLTPRRTITACRVRTDRGVDA